VPSREALRLDRRRCSPAKVVPTSQRPSHEAELRLDNQRSDIIPSLFVRVPLYRAGVAGCSVRRSCPRPSPVAVDVPFGLAHLALILAL